MSEHPESDRPASQSHDAEHSARDASNRTERGDLSATGDVGEPRIPLAPVEQSTAGELQSPTFEIDQSGGPNMSGPKLLESKGPEPLPPTTFEINQSGGPNMSEQEPRSSQGPEPPGMSKAPPEAKPTEPHMSKESVNRSDGPNGVVMGHPMPHGQHGHGRGATGDIGHGLDRDPNTAEWAKKAANDLPAKPGTPVCAAHDGKIFIKEDPHPGTTGGVFGDQVTIVSANGATKTFYTHIDHDRHLKNGQEVRLGQEIGRVANWAGHPNDSHLHFAMAARAGDGTYKGVDPANVLTATEGSAVGRDVTVTKEGGYVVGDQRYTPSPPPALPPLPAPAQPSSDAGAPSEPGREEISL